MANANGRSSSGKKTRSGSRNTSRPSGKSAQAKKAAPQTKRKQEVEPEVTFADYFHEFSKTRIFKFLATVIGVTLVVLLDLLIAWNNYDRFFLFLGIEILMIAVIFIMAFLFNLGSSSDSGV